MVEYIKKYEIDCKNRLTKYKESKDQDDHENALDHKTIQDVEWKSIQS